MLIPISRPWCHRNRSQLLLCLAYFVVISTSMASSVHATTWGVKSEFGTGGSVAPAHRFSFAPAGVAVVDLGAITLSGGMQIDVDGLAVSQAEGLLGYRWTGPGGDSHLVSIDTTTAVATPIGSALAAREVRGAAFIGSALYVVDAANDELLRVDPGTGLLVGSPVGLNLGGMPYDVSNGVDLAIDASGAVYLVSVTKFYLVDLTSGALTEVFDELDAKITRALDLAIDHGDVEEVRERLRGLKGERERVASECAQASITLPSPEDLMPMLRERLLDLEGTLRADLARGRLALGALLGGERLKVYADVRIEGSIIVAPEKLPTPGRTQGPADRVVAGEGFEPPTSGL